MGWAAESREGKGPVCRVSTDLLSVLLGRQGMGMRAILPLVLDCYCPFLVVKVIPQHLLKLKAHMPFNLAIPRLIIQPRKNARTRA